MSEQAMTERENYMNIITGGNPAWVPVYWDAVQWFAPSVIAAPVISSKKVDMYGIRWTVDDLGAIPTPNDFLVKDIADWRSSFTIPNFDDYDWEGSVEKDTSWLDRNKATALHLHSIFNPFVNALGFTEALAAMYEQPDAVLEFFDALSTFQEMLIEKSLQYYDCIDVFTLTDDIATESNLFMSPETYREMILPFHKRQYEVARKVRPDVVLEMHCCGKCDSVIDDWVDLGVTTWQTAQPMNDLDGIKKKYGRRLALAGCWDVHGEGGVPNASEEAVRQSARETIDEFAPGGGFVFWSQGPFGTSNEMVQKLSWLDDEARKYGRDYYKLHGVD